MNKWECQICTYVHEGDNPPDHCPVCYAGPNRFSRIEPKYIKNGNNCKWECSLCTYIAEGNEPPNTCPICHSGPEKFKKIIEVTSEIKRDELIKMYRKYSQ